MYPRQLTSGLTNLDMKNLYKLTPLLLCGLAFPHPCAAQEEAIAESVAESVEVPGTPVEKVKPGIRPLTAALNSRTTTVVWLEP